MCRTAREKTVLARWVNGLLYLDVVRIGSEYETLTYCMPGGLSKSISLAPTVEYLGQSFGRREVVIGVDEAQCTGDRQGRIEQRTSNPELSRD